MRRTVSSAVIAAPSGQAGRHGRLFYRVGLRLAPRTLKTFVAVLGVALLVPFIGIRAAEIPPAYTNHLANQRSPYLLQHAHNPVDWYPWGEEAFAKAKRENKPIFLSIGYSTCHWCHVMEHESFENPVIAKLLNDSFVAIKVDREERPDVDSTYMAFVQATTGGGGWPMTVFTTPDLKPFAGGTYFPPKDRDGQPGLESILPQVADAWKTHQKEVVAQAGEITGKLEHLTSLSPAGGGTEGGKGDTPDKATLEAGLKAISERFDPEHGGFGRGEGPKFPEPVNLNFLTRMVAREGATSEASKHALDMDLTTLRAMAVGGIHDHLGGGFHRYSTDTHWHVPHFEKMLYDQAQLATAYLDAYQITGEQEFADVARDTLDYVHRDLSDPQTGAFFSAEDADSLAAIDGKKMLEGAFYVWKKIEIDAVLGKEAELFEYAYQVEPKGNVPPASDARGELAGQNVLDRTGRSSADVAAKFHLTDDELAAKLAGDRAKLLARRDQRPRPRLDDKTITAWNGLMISAFARAAQVLDDPAYLADAQRAAAFLRANLYDDNTGRLLRSFREGPGSSSGYADDYACLIQGLIDLYEADFDTAHLAWAQSLQKTQDGLFWDEKAGGYFDAAAGQDPHVFLRNKNGEDNAEPSANSVSALNLVRLGQMLENDGAMERSRKTVEAFAALLKQAPLAAPEMLVALDFQLGPTRQIVVAGQPRAADVQAMLRIVRKPFLPRALVILADGGAGQAFFTKQVELLDGMHALEGGKATVYVCQNFACQLPTTDPEKVTELLGK